MPLWHDKETAAVFEELQTSFEGLSQAEAEARLERYGANRLPRPARRSELARFLLQFNNILIYVLFGAAAITASLGHHVDTVVILTVVIVNALISEVQSLTTPLLRQMDTFSRRVTLLIVSLATLVLVWGVIEGGFGFADIFLVVVGIAVAAIPEGLPAVSGARRTEPEPAAPCLRHGTRLNEEPVQLVPGSCKKQLARVGTIVPP